MNNETRNVNNNNQNYENNESKKGKKVKALLIIIGGFLAFLFIFSILLPNKFSAMLGRVEEIIKDATGISVDLNGDGVGSSSSVKPVIYVYGAKDNQDVNVKLITDSEISCEYPIRNNKDTWNIKADTDGTLHIDGLDYNYIYWEGINRFEPDFSTGFCVKGDETREFLESSLNKLGLTRREANEFIVYWLPILEANKYNLISFQSEAYTNEYKLDIEPNTNNILRVYIAYKPLEKEIDIKEQDLNKITGNFKREGLYVVEWGGRLVN